MHKYNASLSYCPLLIRDVTGLMASIGIRLKPAKYVRSEEKRSDFVTNCKDWNHIWKMTTNYYIYYIYNRSDFYVKYF